MQAETPRQFVGFGAGLDAGLGCLLGAGDVAVSMCLTLRMRIVWVNACRCDIAQKLD